jgi:HAE1 family hydrophobic/amphiphilic exporter-1
MAKRMANFTERLFDGSLRIYDDAAVRASASRRDDGAVVFIAGAAYLFLIVPEGFHRLDQAVSTSALKRSRIGFEEMVRHQQEVAAILAQDPDISGSSSSTGVGGGRAARARRIKAASAPT